MQNQELLNDNKTGTEPAEFPGLRANNIFFSGITGKIRNRIAIISSIALFFLLILSYLIVRVSVKNEAKGTLETISSLKTQQLESYFTGLGNQLLLIANEQQVRDAFDQLKAGYSNLQDESLSFPNASGTTDADAQVRDYYETEVVKRLNSMAGLNLTVNEEIPATPEALTLQYLYIKNNPSVADRSKMTNGGDNSSYSSAHSQYHSIFRNIRSMLGINDVLLIDGETGNVIYSAQKNLDFATNLYNGPGKNSLLAQTYEQAMGLTKGKTVLSDIGLYKASLMKPVMFIAVPLWENNLKKGVLVAQVSSGRLSDILNKSGNIENKGFFEKSGNAYLVGEDFASRTDDKRLKTSKTGFISGLKRSDTRKETLAKIDSLNTNVGLLVLPKNIFDKALLGYESIRQFRDFTGTKVLAAITPVHINDRMFFMITQGDKKEFFRTSARLLLYGIPVVFILILSVFFAGTQFGNSFTQRILGLKEKMTLLFYGQISEPLAENTHDELAETSVLFNKLSSRIEESFNFTLSLASGNTDVSFESLSEEDNFASTLNKLKDNSLQSKIEDEKRKAEDEIRNWNTHGIAKFNDLLRQHNDDLNKFTFTITKDLNDYLSASQGTMFLVDEDEKEGKIIRLTAAYAFDRRKFIKKEIKLGEGLLGTCVLEKQSIYLKEIPEGYLEITSGLGHADPKALLIVPMIFNDEVVGVFEFASFNEFKPYEIEFAEKIAGNTANTLYSVRLNMRTKELLEESNERTEELAAQEEEMRQNLEELKATQEEMARIKQEESEKEKGRREKEKLLMTEMKKQNEDYKEKQRLLEWENILFNTLMDNLPLRVTYKDNESRYVRVNKNKLATLGIEDENLLIGKTDYDVFENKHTLETLEEEKKLIQSGIIIKDKEERIPLKDGRVRWGSTTRTPLINKDGEILGCLVITNDITDIKTCRFELETSKQIFGKALEVLPILNYRVDSDGNILEFSGKGLEYMMFNEKDLIGKEFIKLYPEAADLLDKQPDDKGYSFVQTGPDWEFRHFVFSDKANTGGFSGIAFETRLNKDS